MEEAAAREAATTHAQAMLEGDYATAGAALGPDVQAVAGEVLREIPRQLTSAEVESAEREGEAVVCRIRYSGEGATTTVASRWEDVGGKPTIVGLDVVDKS
jgi:hypothetical protein